MSTDSDSSYPIPLPEPKDDADLFQPISYSPKPFEFIPHSLWLDRTPESIIWECKERAAQLQALALIHHRLDCCNIPMLEYPWSDALYPSLVKVWGIDRFDEDSAIYLDQVWLERWHPDRPQEWFVIATTTDEHPLSAIQLEDGTWANEGTRAYLDRVLSRMRDSLDKDARQLSTVLSGALMTHQVRYRHLHSAYHPQTEELQIIWFYEFPIYPTDSRFVRI